MAKGKTICAAWPVPDAAHGMVERARMVLACTEGESHIVIGSRLGISKMTVGKWRWRYLE